MRLESEPRSATSSPSQQQRPEAAATPPATSALLQRKLQRRLLQRRSEGAATGGDAASLQRLADAGVGGSGGSLPHLERIQASFGRHDVSHVRAHVGGAARDASEAIGAEAYATGDQVAFRGAPDLHTAAHEAAHVIQQQGGVSLKGGVGEEGDAHERHADAVADRVVQGKSAEGLLDRYAGAGSPGRSTQRSVQRKIGPGAPVGTRERAGGVAVRLERQARRGRQGGVGEGRRQEQEQGRQLRRHERRDPGRRLRHHLQARRHERDGERGARRHPEGRRQGRHVPLQHDVPDEMTATTLTGALGSLARALDRADAATLARLDARVRAYGLDDAARVPPWLPGALEALAGARATADWVSFARGDASEAMELVRELPGLLPVEVVDEGELVRIAAPRLGVEAFVTFEGASWFVGPVGSEPP